MEINIPTPHVPSPPPIPRMTLKVPTARVPGFRPMVIPPTDLERPEGVEAEPNDEADNAGLKTVQIPIIDIKMPVPEQEILVTAGTTAAVSVVATLTATSVFKYTVKVLKPVLQQVVNRIKKKFNGSRKTENSTDKA